MPSESGDFDRSWTVCGQWHADTSSSPPFELGFRSGLGLNKLTAVVRTGAHTSPTETEYTLTASALERDRWYHIRTSYKADPTNGFIHVDIDGTRVLTVTGHTGFTAQTYVYWRFGIYRNSSSTLTNIVEYKRLRIGTSIPEVVGVPPPNLDAFGRTGTLTQSGAASGNVSTSLTGVAGTGAPGTVSVTAIQNVQAALTGVKGTGNAGSLTTKLGASTALTGVGGIGQAGTLAVTAGGAVQGLVDGVGGSGRAGEITVTTTSTGVTQPVVPGGGGGPASPERYAARKAYERAQREREKAIERTLRGEVPQKVETPPAALPEVKAPITLPEPELILPMDVTPWAAPDPMLFGGFPVRLAPPPLRFYDPEEDAAVLLLHSLL